MIREIFTQTGGIVAREAPPIVPWHRANHVLSSADVGVG